MKIITHFRGRAPPRAPSTESNQIIQTSPQPLKIARLRGGSKEDQGPNQLIARVAPVGVTSTGIRCCNWSVTMARNRPGEWGGVSQRKSRRYRTYLRKMMRAAVSR